MIKIDKKGKGIISLTIKRKDLEAVLNELENKEKELSIVSKKLEVLKSEYQKWVLAKKESEDNLKKRKKSLLKDIELLEEKKKSVLAKIEQSWKDLIAADKKLTNFKSQISIAEKKLFSLYERKKEISKEISQLESVLSDRISAKKELSETLNEIVSAKSELNSLTSKIKQAKKLLDNYKKTYDSWIKRVEELRSWSNDLAHREQEMVRVAVSLGVYSPNWKKKIFSKVGENNKNNGYKKTKKGGNKKLAKSKEGS